jgi:hypothetical protein
LKHHNWFSKQDFLNCYGQDMEALFCGAKREYKSLNAYINYLLKYSPCDCNKCLNCCQVNEIKDIAMLIFYDEVVTNQKSDKYYLLDKYVVY